MCAGFQALVHPAERKSQGLTFPGIPGSTFTDFAFTHDCTGLARPFTVSFSGSNMTFLNGNIGYMQFQGEQPALLKLLSARVCFMRLLAVQHARPCTCTGLQHLTLRQIRYEHLDRHKVSIVTGC